MKGIACAFEGRLGKDAVLKSTGTGRAFMVMSVIVGEDEEAEWINVSAWNDHLIDLAEHLKSGVAVYVEGKLKMRRWENPEGSRSGLQVSASLVQPLALIGRSKPKAPRAGKKANGKAVDSQKPIGVGESGRPFDDSLPF